MNVASGGTLKPALRKVDLGDGAGVLAQHRLHLVFVPLMYRLSIRLDRAHHDDQRIGAGIDRLLAAFVELLANRYVVQLGAVDDFLGALLRRLAGQRLSSRSALSAPSTSLHFGQALGQLHLAPATCKSERWKTAAAPA